MTGRAIVSVIQVISPVGAMPDQGVVFSVDIQNIGQAPGWITPFEQFNENNHPVLVNTDTALYLRLQLLGLVLLTASDGGNVNPETGYSYLLPNAQSRYTFTFTMPNESVSGYINWYSFTTNQQEYEDDTAHISVEHIPNSEQKLSNTIKDLATGGIALVMVGTILSSFKSISK